MTRNSPSSINTYLQCPRLYYYQFIERRPSVPHIDLIKGAVVHKTLEAFFDEDPSVIETNPKQWAETRLKRIFMKSWDERKVVIEGLGIPESKKKDCYEECLEMVNYWLKDYLERATHLNIPLIEAFQKIKPLAEQEYYLKKYDIKGFIDSVEEVDGEIRLIDYKTGSKFEITKEYRLQLAIYAFLYQQKHGKLPDKVGVFFLKEKLHLISVDEAMIEFAEKECKNIYEKTQSQDIENYPQNTGYMCKCLGNRCRCHSYEEDTE